MQRAVARGDSPGYNQGVMTRTRPIGQLALAGLALTACPATAQDTPFGHLHAPPEVIASGSEEAIWFGLDPTDYVIRLPAGFRNRDSAARSERDPRYEPRLGIHCRRSASDSEALGFRSGLHVEIVIPRMTDDPTASLAVRLLDPRYWYYELTGQAVREVPLEVSVDGGPASAAHLRIHRTDYSAPRPALYAYLPERAVLERVAAGLHWTLEAVGEEAAFTMRFPPGPEPVRAAAQGVLEICLEGGP